MKPPHYYDQELWLNGSPLGGFHCILFYSAPSLGAKYEFGNWKLICSKLFLQKYHSIYYLQ